MTSNLPSFAPVPSGAEGPAIPEHGYLRQEIGDGLHLVTDGVYQMMFLVTDDGVIAVDAPPALGRSILPAVAEVTSRPVTHVVHSHHHFDHIGAASIYPRDAQ
ncbi:MBL fold metallo-hydrolase [Cryptosporangium arvum]|uniref:MBL fold metallo-hydrolase n=1 Tax=Cryptosporangium arvum TaxID=80871 RepID=UPI0004B256B0|nr:MBL fold metallo-hydrolase [Cryptosporangium arvum]